MAGGRGAGDRAVAMAEILKGVHMVDTYANTFFLADQRLILVDTATADGGPKVLDYLKRIRMKPSDIGTIFVTHTHPDHVGGLAAIKKVSPAKVAASRAEADFISKRKTYTGPPGAPAPRRPGPQAMDDAYNGDPKQHRASIKKLAGFDFENLVMGHGTPVLGGASKRVKELAARL